MKKEEITAVFDQQAPSYDERWSKTASINSALHLLTSNVLSELPSDARILCVGAGTGAEILYLAQKFSGWHFTAVEPSSAMLDVFGSRMEEHGIASRCTLHCGYLDSLQSGITFNAATSFLVSQFILERENRSKFFRDISDCLLPEGILVSSDLAGDLEKSDGQRLLQVWCRLTGADGSPEEIERMKENYARDVAVLPPLEVCEIISLGGFDAPVQFYQAGLINAWFAKRSPDEA